VVGGLVVGNGCPEAQRGGGTWKREAGWRGGWLLG